MHWKTPLGSGMPRTAGKAIGAEGHREYNALNQSNQGDQMADKQTGLDSSRSHGWLFRRRICSVIWMGVAIALSGCATSSLFTPYPYRAAEIKQQLIQGEYDRALNTLGKFANSKDKALYMLEHGRVAQIAGRHGRSRDAFEVVIAAENEADEKAKITLTGMAAKGSSLLVNDNAIPYRAAAYERILLHNYQALNYLALDNLEAAGVEVRRAALEQRDALERHHRELARLDEQAREQAALVQRSQAMVDQRFSRMRAAVAELKNSFQSAYTFYVSGVIYELLGEPNDAYIDYRKALEIYPGNPYVQADLLRLSKQLGFLDDYERYRQQFGMVASETPGRELIVFYEEGFVPAKQQVFIDFFTPHGVQAVAFPFYAEAHSPLRPLVVFAGGELLGRTALITDVQALAIKDLEEKLPAITVRQVLRVIAKYQLQRQAEENMGTLGGVMTMIYNLASEAADLRSWLTLPSKVAILRSRLPEGAGRIELDVPGYHLRQVVELDEQQRGPVILHVVAIDGRMEVRRLR